MYFVYEVEYGTNNEMEKIVFSFYVVRIFFLSQQKQYDRKNGTSTVLYSTSIGLRVVIVQYQVGTTSSTVLVINS